MHSTTWTGKAASEQRPYTPGPTIPRTEETVTMHHHGDRSGNVRFWLPNRVANVTTHHHAGPNEESMAEVHIPFEAIKLLVIEYYRDELIRALENAEGEELEDLITFAHIDFYAVETKQHKADGSCCDKGVAGG